MYHRNIAVCIPTRGFIFTEAVERISNSLNDIDRDLHGFVDWFTCSNLPIPLSRNFLIEKALKDRSYHRYILLADDDVVPPLKFLERSILEDHPVVIADYPAKETTKSQIVKQKDGTILVAPFGCALIKREVFEKIGSPWFDNKPSWRLDRDDKFGYRLEKVSDEPNRLGGEEVNFIMKLKEHNIPIEVFPYGATHLELLNYTKPTLDNRIDSCYIIKQWNITPQS